MSKNTVTQSQINSLLAQTEFQVKTFYGKVTVVVAKLPNGFTIVESSGCVDPDNYNELMGLEICKERIENQLWQLEGYLLQEQLYKAGEL
jgi:hypothetical protein